MLHMIRQILGDSSFRGLLHGLTTTFYHKTVTSQEIESYISQFAKKDLSKVFSQYLRTTQIPELEYKFNSGTMLSYHWTKCVSGFNMPVKVSVAGQAEQWIEPTTEWKTLNFGGMGVGVDSARTAVIDSTKVADSSKIAGADPARISTADSTRTGGGIGGKDLVVNRNFYVTVKKLN